MKRGTIFAVGFGAVMLVSGVTLLIKHSDGSLDSVKTQSGKTQILSENQKTSMMVKKDESPKEIMLVSEQSLNVPQDGQGSEIIATENVAHPKLWKPSGVAGEILRDLGYLPPTLAGEVFIEIDITDFESLKEGENFSVDIPQLSTEFEAEVTKVTQVSEDIRTLSARLTGDNQDHNVLISYGGGGVYGSVSTPDGTYLIEGTDEYAWMAPRQDMAAKTLPDSAVRDGIRDLGKNRTIDKDKNKEAIKDDKLTL